MNNQNPDDEKRDVVEQNLDTERELPDPLSTPELPENTLSDKELDDSLPVLRKNEEDEEK